LKRLGIDFLYIDTTTICKIPEINSLDVIKERIDGTYVTKAEGNIEMTLKNPTATPLSLTTYLRSDPDWYVFIDGKRASLDKTATFMIFTLPIGEHNVQFKFIPYSFYKGVGLSIVSGGILILGYYLGRKKLYKFLDN
jgi:uncharacterized membrane protein YfhO